MQIVHSQHAIAPCIFQYSSTPLATLAFSTSIIYELCNNKKQCISYAETCKDNPCHANATCSDLQIGGVKCQCRAGFTGDGRKFCAGKIAPPWSYLLAENTKRSVAIRLYLRALKFKINNNNINNNYNFFYPRYYFMYYLKNEQQCFIRFKTTSAARACGFRPDKTRDASSLNDFKNVYILLHRSLYKNLYIKISI